LPLKSTTSTFAIVFFQSAFSRQPSAISPSFGEATIPALAQKAES
jgi:hypothetical protein